MTVNDWLAQATKDLLKANIETARLDALVLLEDQLSVDRARLLAHPDMEISPADKNVLNQWILRRARHEPLAYVRGKAEFYGREFAVSDAVLVPRPETEDMIDLLKEAVKNNPQIKAKLAARAAAAGPLSINGASSPKKAQKWPIRVADVGSGSGAIGITAALELPQITVDLLEIDDKAIKIAKSNVVAHATGNLVIKSDLLAQTDQNYDILLCNLPYVPDDYQINQAAGFEPKIALFGGPDGLDLYRKLFSEIQNLDYQVLYIIIEILPFQKTALLEIAGAAGYTLAHEKGFIFTFNC